LGLGLIHARSPSGQPNPGAASGCQPCNSTTRYSISSLRARGLDPEGQGQLADIATGRVEPPRVQLKAPPGITYVYTLNGQQSLVQDGYVSVAADDAPPRSPGLKFIFCAAI
jgi:hypothetical protein